MEGLEVALGTNFCSGSLQTPHPSPSAEAGGCTSAWLLCQVLPLALMGPFGQAAPSPSSLALDTFRD